MDIFTALVYVTNIVTQKMEYPVVTNKCYRTLCLPLANRQHATVIRRRLNQVLSTVPKEDRIILLDSFSARVGRDSSLYKGTLRKEGVGKINSILPNKSS